MVTSGERNGERGKIWVGVKRYKLLYGTRIYCIAQEIKPMPYNNFKWSIIYKDIESLCCIPETNIVNEL